MFKTRFNRIAGRQLDAIGLIAAACLLSTTLAGAHQSPPTCTGNNLGLDLQKNKTQIVSGETVHFTVSIRNDAASACDVTGANATFTCPAPDGTPTGATTLCANGAAFLAGFPPTTICAVDCVVTVNPGVTSAQAKAEVHGTLHDTPINDFDTADVVKFISLQILRCGDGLVNRPGETCDPPGSAAGASGNICRTDCTVCGDGHVDAGEQCDDGNNVDGDGCQNNCTTAPRCGDGVVDAGEECDDGNLVDGDGCSASCQTEGGFCPTFNPVLGAAGDCTILNFGGSFTSTGPAGQYQGDLCMGDSARATFSGSNFVTGKVRLSHDATCSGCTPQRVLGGVELDADLATEVQACQDARKSNTPVSLGGSGPECTETVTTLQSIAVNGIITRSGTNIICLTQNQTVKGLQLAGDATTKYVFVVEKAFKFQDGKLQAVAPVGSDDVLWLFVGASQALTSSGGGGGASCCKAVLDGSVIIDGKIALAPGLINGQVCGTGDWDFVSGSGVHCPPEP